VETLDHYLAMPAKTFGLLPFGERMAVNTKLQADAKAPIHIPWGSYTEDVPHLQLMLDRAPGEFRMMRNFTLKLVTNKTLLVAFLAQTRLLVAQQDEKFDKGKERAEFGQWMADYLDDAGYSSWIQYPDMYKALIMNAFPPLEELDDLTGARQGDFTVADFEEKMLKWMEVMDLHISSSKSHSKTMSLAAAGLGKAA
jgi:hypothetical protein